MWKKNDTGFIFDHMAEEKRRMRPSTFAFFIAEVVLAAMLVVAMVCML